MIFHHSICSLQNCVHTTAVASTSFLVLRLLPERHSNRSQHVKKNINSYRGFRRFSDIHRTVLTSSECERDLDLENNVPPFKGSAQVDLWRHRPIAKAADKAVKYWAAKARSHKLCMRVFSLHITILLVLLFSPSFFDSVFLQLDSEVDAPAVNMPGTHLRFFQQR